MIHRFFAFVFVGTLLLSGGAARAEVRLETSLDPREGTVGDFLQLKITLRAPAPALPCTPTVGQSLGPFEVISSSSETHRMNGPFSEQTFRFTLALYDVGVSTLPAVSIACTEAGKTTEVKTPEIPVTIRSVLTKDSKDIHGLKGRLKKVLNRPVAWGLLMLLLLGAGGAAWARFRPGRPPSRPAGPPPVPAHLQALEDLRQLEEDAEAPAKIFYSRLTDILRAYLEGAFHTPTMDRTTAEITGALKSLTLTLEQRMGLRTVLENGDLAKFAKLEPSLESRRQDFDRVRHFVTATAPPPVAP